MAAEKKAMIFPNILRNSLKEWLRIKRRPDIEVAGEEVKSVGSMDTSLRKRNVPIGLIVKEAIQRFQEVLGVRAESI